MTRPKRCRKVAARPGYQMFKPAGRGARRLPEVNLTVDEFEALRLADHQGLYQQEAAQKMEVSRQTFGRIVDSARRKVATALVEGLAIRIEGGEVEMAETRSFQCGDCGHAWEEPYGTGRPAACPACQSESVERAEEVAEEAGRGAGRGRHGRGGGKGRGGRGGGKGRGGRGGGQGRAMGRGMKAGRATGETSNVAKETATEENGD